MLEAGSIAERSIAERNIAEDEASVHLRMLAAASFGSRGMFLDLEVLP